MKEYAQAVVLEALEAMAAPLDPLDAEVEALGGTVGCAALVVGEDLGAPRLERVAEGADLLHVVGGAAGDGLVEQRRRRCRIVGEVDVPNRFLSVNRP
jgi:hypothetical protein